MLVGLQKRVSKVTITSPVCMPCASVPIVMLTNWASNVLCCRVQHVLAMALYSAAAGHYRSTAATSAVCSSKVQKFQNTTTCLAMPNNNIHAATADGRWLCHVAAVCVMTWCRVLYSGPAQALATVCTSHHPMASRSKQKVLDNTCPSGQVESRPGVHAHMQQPRKNPCMCSTVHASCASCAGGRFSGQTRSVYMSSTTHVGEKQHRLGHAVADKSHFANDRLNGQESYTTLHRPRNDR
jgi:hypothetical protein